MRLSSIQAPSTCQYRHEGPYIANSREAAREIAKSGTDIPILLFSLNLSPQIMELARSAGLRGAMSKSEISKLPYAIRALQRGETFFYAS